MTIGFVGVWLFSVLDKSGQADKEKELLRRSKCARKPVWVPLAHQATKPSCSAAAGALQLSRAFESGFLCRAPKTKTPLSKGQHEVGQRGAFKYCSVLPQQLAQLDKGQRRHHRIVESIMSAASGSSRSCIRLSKRRSISGFC